MQHRHALAVGIDSTPTFVPGVRRLVDRLVAEAIRTGRLRATTPAETAHPFTPGLSAQAVMSIAPVLPRVVVKAGGDPGVADQAHYLLELAADQRLPGFLRRAFPTVYASWTDPDGASADGVCGYLMEDVSTHDTMFAHVLRSAGPEGAAAAARSVCAFLEQAYAATRSDGAPDLQALYHAPSARQLQAAAYLDPRLASDRRIVLRRGGSELHLPSWGRLLGQLAHTLAGCTSAGGTWAHGDLVAWNVLVACDEGMPAVRLIDPAPGIDDYAHDIGRLIMSLRYMHLADGDVPEPRLAVEGDALTIEYAVPLRPTTTLTAESVIVERMARFGAARGDRNISTRLEIATAAALLGDLPQLASAAPRRRQLARLACAEALLLLSAATGLVDRTT